MRTNYQTGNRHYKNLLKSISVRNRAYTKYKQSSDIADYIRDEFFKVKPEIFDRIASLYKQLYGQNAYSYMVKTYHSWKAGYVNVSQQTLHRILECVPKFLPDDKKFYILKYEIISFINLLHAKHQNKNYSLDQLNALFENYSIEIDNFKEVNLSWFTQGVYTSTEIEQFLSICKYSLFQKLDLSYRQVQNDFKLIKLKLVNLKKSTYSANYKIDFLSSNIDISQISDFDPKSLQFKQHEIILEGRFKQFTEEYIMHELVEMTFTEQNGVANHFIKSNDLESTIKRYNELLSVEMEVQIQSEFKGEGGLLSLSIEIKPIKMIKAHIRLTVVKIILFTLVISALIIAVLSFKLYKSSVLLVILILYIGIILLGMIKSEFIKLSDLKTDLKNHGKQY